jgi:hypothetical protein
LPAWRDALLREIASEKVNSSRGRLNPRGVKRKMSGYKVRRRGQPLHLVHLPVPKII